MPGWSICYNGLTGETHFGGGALTMNQPADSASLPMTEQQRQRRNLLMLSCVAILAAVCAAWVFRGELFGDGDDRPTASPLLIEKREAVEALKLWFPGRGGDAGAISLILRNGHWMLADADTLANQATVNDLLSALASARRDSSPLSTTEAAARELGLADDSLDIAAVWWGDGAGIPSDSKPMVYAQHGKFREAGSFEVRRFGMAHVPSDVKAWQADAVSILGNADPEAVVAIELRDEHTFVESSIQLPNGAARLPVSVWRVMRQGGGGWICDRTNEQATEARVASCLFYAGMVPVTGPHAQVSLTMRDGGETSRVQVLPHPRYILEFTLRDGSTRMARLGLPDRSQPQAHGLLTVPHLGKGIYRIGLVQLRELAPSLRILTGNPGLSDEPNFGRDTGTGAGSNEPPAPTAADPKWHGIDPANYKFIVFTAINRRFPGAMPSTRPYAEALAAATAVLGEITDASDSRETTFSQLAVRHSDWRGEAAGAPTLAAHPSGTAPTDVIEAAKQLKPGELTPHPIDAEDGIYVILRVR